MGSSVQAEGDSAQEAIDAALEELGVGPEEVDIEIVEEANKGLLGLRRGRAKVIVTVKDHAYIAQTIIEEIADLLDVDCDVEIYVEDDETWVAVSGESLSWLIGHHGRTLDALQVVVGAIVNKRMKASVRVILDVEGYRARRKREVKEIAERTIGKVLAQHEAIALRPMSAMERKTVHTTAGQYDGISTISEGSEPDRYVVIEPADTD